MGRKTRRQAGEITKLGEVPVPAAPAAVVEPAALSLDEIRREALNQSTRTAQTIARLEAWRVEIDATIAFLRSQRTAD